jgi:hypothetical protein
MVVAFDLSEENAADLYKASVNPIKSIDSSYVLQIRLTLPLLLPLCITDQALGGHARHR